MSNRVDLRRAALYVRVACLMEGGDAAPQSQLARCAELARERGYVAAHSFIDAGVSGLSANRPGFRGLQEVVCARFVDAVIATDATRFGRSGALVDAFFRLARDNDVDVVLADEGAIEASTLAAANLQMRMVRVKSTPRSA